MTSWTLGLGLSHDSSGCLFADDEPIVGVQLERLTRHKYDGRKSEMARLVNYLLDVAGIGVDDLDTVAVSYPNADLPGRLQVGGLDLGAGNVLHVGHHLAHAYSAFGSSGLDEAAVLVVDGHGDPYYEEDQDQLYSGPEMLRRLTARLTAPDDTFAAPRFESESIYRFTRTGSPELLHRGHLTFGRRTGYTPLLFDPLGIGQNYRQVSAWLFGTGKSAGKVMGLASYAKEPLDLPPTFLAGPDGTPVLTDTWKAAVRDVLAADPTIVRDHEWAAGLAGYVQAATEELLLDLVRRAIRLSGTSALCMAGGVALNATTNGRIEREEGLSAFYVQPASSDAGLAIGAALAARHLQTGRIPARQPVRDSWGRRYSPTEVAAAIGRHPEMERLPIEDPVGMVAERLAAGEVIGWFEGGAELGPRALGHRSLVADPRSLGMRDHLNRNIKKREWFRPFAPAVLVERFEDWFQPGGASRFMLSTTLVRRDRRGQVPAITHVDGTARVQVVSPGEGEFRRLIEEFHRRTGVPMILNTSFNAAGEPIVETPEDALRAAEAMGISLLYLDGILVRRNSIESP